ncbi:MAG TPA: hypothetical protein VF062_27080 [Candidatus Limnocylindrales bacterium]
MSDSDPAVSRGNEIFVRDLAVATIQDGSLELYVRGTCSPGPQGHGRG